VYDGERVVARTAGYVGEGEHHLRCTGMRGAAGLGA
jgi:hypothetical protein